jgi:hypothetical protein
METPSELNCKKPEKYQGESGKPLIIQRVGIAVKA